MKKIIFLVLTLISVTSFSINYDDCLGYWKNKDNDDILIEKINDNEYILTVFNYYFGYSYNREEEKYPLKPTPYGLLQVNSRDENSYIYNTEIVTRETIKNSCDSDDLQLGKKTLQILVYYGSNKLQYNKNKLNKKSIEKINERVLNRVVYDINSFNYTIEY